MKKVYLFCFILKRSQAFKKFFCAVFVLGTFFFLLNNSEAFAARAPMTVCPVTISRSVCMGPWKLEIRDKKDEKDNLAISLNGVLIIKW